MLNKKILSISYKEIWRITYPIIFGNLAQTIIVFVDTIFLGHLGTSELGAAMIAGMYYLVFTAVVQGFTVGTQIIVSRRFGEKNITQIGKVFKHSLYLSLFLGLILLLFLFFTTDILFCRIIKSNNILNLSLQFLKYRQWGIIFVCMNYLFRALYIGLSNTRVITYSTIMMAIVNTFLNFLLIFGKLGFPELGIKGAAISSVAAEMIATIIFLCYTFFVLDYKKYFLFKRANIDIKIFQNILKISLPTMFQKLISYGTWFIFFALIEHLGEQEIAISGIVRSIYMICTISIFAYSATANTITSRLIGANKHKEVLGTLYRIVKISLLTLTPILIIFSIIPQRIASIYTNDQLLALQSVPSLYVVFISTLILAVSYIFFEFISGTGNTLAALILEIIVTIFYLLYIYLTSSVFNFEIQYIWFSEGVYGIGLLIGSLIYLKYSKWDKQSIHKV